MRSRSHSSPCRSRIKNIVRRQRPPDPLQLELTHRLDLHGVLNGHQHPRTDEDLPGLRLVAEPRGDVGDRADGGIVEATLEADGAERRKSVRNADAEANVMSRADATSRSMLR